MSGTISNLSLQLQSVTSLQNQETLIEQLNQQLASGKLHDNLTDYDPTTANNLMNFQNTITQKQAYLASMTNVQTRLTVYDQTMTDMEGITSQAQALASSNQTQNATSTPQIQAQVQSYLKQLTADLNEQVGGRYLYSGARYTTPPVVDLTTLTGTPAFPFTAVTANALPTYDSQYGGSNNAVTIASTPTGNFQIGNSSISWSDIAAGSITSVDVNGTPTTVTAVTGLTTPATTPAELASNLQTAISQLSSVITDFSGVTASASGATVSFSAPGGGTPSITPDQGGATGETSWSSATDGTQAQSLNSSADAWAQDSVNIDSSFSVQYGVNSNNAAFQQLIAGLQFMNAATQTGVSAATYKTDMANANALLTAALPAIQSLHTTVASNENLLTTETNTQGTDITNLQNQITNLQQVNVAEIGTQINVLQAQLQASYSATASLEQLSILKYL